MIHHPHYRSGVLLLAMVLMVFSSCNDHHQTGAAGSKRVVVIFQDCRDQTVASRFGGTISTAGEKTISYVDAAGYQVKYSPRSIGYDTLIIPTYCGYAELMHLYAVEEPIFWLLKEGDTVLVTVGDKGRPQLSSLNQENTWLYNLPWHDSRAVHANGYSLKTILDNPYFQRIDIYMKDPGQQRKAPSIMKKLAPEYVNLDSLRVVYEAYIKDFSDSLAVWEAMDRIPKKYADYYRDNYIGDGFFIRDIRNSDSLRHFVSNLRKIPKDESADQIVNVDKSNVGTDGKYTFDLLLEDDSGKQTALNEVLAVCKGKAIYVDFWASWCAPCREEMPASAKLRANFLNRPVLFLFLSTDKDATAWKEAEKVCGISGENVLSYRILNRDAIFLEQLKMKTIPRHLLFDKEGTLIVANAPRAGSSEVSSSIESAINQ